MLGRKIARHGIAILATALIGGFLSATLVRLAPGFDADEAQLDPHLSSESIQALRQLHREQRNISHFYFQSLQRASHGDLGRSLSLGQPVAELLRQRVPLTLRLVALGFFLSWAGVLGFALATIADAMIQAKNTASGEVRTATSNSQGRYHLQNGASTPAQPGKLSSIVTPFGSSRKSCARFRLGTSLSRKA